MEVQVNSVTVAEYVYDGDGNQVKAVVTGGDLTITTIFVGSYYEQITTVDASVTPAVTTTAWKKYYYAGAVRLAMREDSDDPLYLIGDHLGSTSLVLDTSGLEVAKQSYLPFGEDWGVSATELPTDYTFTGQREAAEVGLMYYVARWYDSEIGHFIQADTIIPGAGNVLAWNRYAYVLYNPIKFTDPTGHWCSGDHYDPACAETGSELAQVYQVKGLVDHSLDTSIVPDWIPTRNEELFSAYLYLFTQTTDIPYGFGGQFTTSGYELGMVIAENHIEIVFDDLCAGACVQSGIPIIHIASSRQGDSQMNLSQSISHESFHKTNPFKHGNVSMYEELFARHVSGVVTNNPNVIISQTDLDNALDPNLLDQALANAYGYNENPYLGKVDLYYPSAGYYLLAQYYFTPSSPMRDR